MGLFPIFPGLTRLDASLYSREFKKMDIDLAQQAVVAALSGNWKTAIKLNKKILSTDTKNVDALNRLARAYGELGEIKKAYLCAKKVLKTDPTNKIAEKSLKKWKEIKSNEGVSPAVNSFSPHTFLEEPGKTKLVTLLNLGDTAVLINLDTGDEVELTPHAHRVSVLTKDGKYIGRLPDDLAARLKNFMKQGNGYEVLIKSNDPEEIKVFIREVRKSEKLADIPSFQSEKIDYATYTPPELVHKGEESPTQVESDEE